MGADSASGRHNSSESMDGGTPFISLKNSAAQPAWPRKIPAGHGADRGGASLSRCHSATGLWQKTEECRQTWAVVAPVPPCTRDKFLLLKRILTAVSRNIHSCENRGTNRLSLSPPAETQWLEPLLAPTYAVVDPSVLVPVLGIPQAAMLGYLSLKLARRLLSHPLSTAEVACTTPCCDLS